jgi:glycosyltransferase involved in cell wall biosynthesis
MLSTFPPRLCGLATFAGALSMAMERLGTVVERVQVDDGRASPGRDAPTSLSARRRRVDRASEALAAGEVAIVQHEFGIFGGRDGDEVLDVLEALTVPSIVVLHSVPADPTAHQRHVLEAVCAEAGCVVVMAFAAGERLLSSYDVDASRVVMIPHGATLPVERRPVALDPVQRPLRLLTWGLLGRGKGIEHVVTALSMLQDCRTQVRYTVAGATHPNVFAAEGDRYRHSLSRRSWALGVAGAVRFDERYRDVSALVRFVESHSVVVLPYDSRDQATSGVLVDAIAAGRPVIATAFPHAVELLSDGAGIVVPHRDPLALATAIRSVLRDPERLAAMSARAVEMSSRFSWGTVAGRYLELCDELQPAAAGSAS